MPSYNIELNNNPIKDSNIYQLLLRITVERKHARLKLDYAVAKKHFNAKAKPGKYIRQSHPKHKTINDHIEGKIQDAKDAVKELEDSNKLVTASSIRTRMLEPDSTSFFEYYEEFVQELVRTGNIGNSKKYNVILQKLKKFQDGNDLLLHEIDTKYLNKFHAYLLSIGNGVNTINNNFRAFKAVYYRAIKEGLIGQENNPFFSFRLKLQRKETERLAMDEIVKIEELQLENDTLIWNVKNAFLFSFYCAGIRVSDILLMKWENVVKGRLVYRMHKTRQELTIKLWEKPLAVLEYYRVDAKSNHFIFPFFDKKFDYSDPAFLHNQISAKTALINKYLKIIATKAEIDKRITTHTARHSFADLARQKTDNLYNLSKTLGHSSIKITEAYLASFDEKAVDDTIDDVFG